jgi:site-specific recombinase XerD
LADRVSDRHTPGQREHLAALQDLREVTPEPKPHDLRHGVAHEVLEQWHDLEEVRALLGHAWIDTT